MTNIFKGRHFLAEKDFTRAELEWLIDFAAHLKDLKKRNIPHRYLEGKNIALLFEKTSTRTRAAFTVAAIDLGAHPEYLGANDIQLGKKESTEDTAKVLGRMFDGIEFRGFSQKMVEELAEFSGVPVWNGLTDEWHPTQMLADYLTVKENFGKLEGLTLVYCGDGRNNVANSLLVTGAILGVNVHIFSPKELFPDETVVTLAEGFAKELDKLVVILKKYPNMSIELGSHTDCRASAKYNMDLSQKRAKSAVEYVDKNGIDSKRLSYKGYGESELVNKCECEGDRKVPCTEEEHQQNRRTEFKIISIK